MDTFSDNLQFMSALSPVKLILSLRQQELASIDCLYCIGSCYHHYTYYHRQVECPWT